MRLYIKNSYKKALKVVESCTNQNHISGARRYLNLFFKSHSSFDKNLAGLVEVRIAEEYIAKAYARLYRKLDEIEKSLK